MEMDASYQLLACLYLREQLDKLRQELRGVRRNREIEPVHQARVASRRMRAALRMFGNCFDAKKVVRWEKRAKRLTKGLGAARDKDVQIEFVEEFLAKLDSKDRRHRPGVQRLLLRLRQGRAALQPDVIRTLDKLEDGILAEMCGEMAKVLFTLKSHDVPLQSPVLFKRTGAHIRDRMTDLLAWEYALEDPDDGAGHHQLRIGAKKLRYTLEICQPAYDGQLGPFVKAVKRVQTLLGDIHDCDVWVEDVGVFMERERLATIGYYGHVRPFHRLKPGLLLLRDERQNHRKRLFAELLEFWKTLGEDRLWDSLAETLEIYRPMPESSGDEAQGRKADGGEEEFKEDRAVE